MKNCTVSILGKDGETHTLNTTAASLFDAAQQAERESSRLWWWDGKAVAEVRSGNQVWRVSVERVRKWPAGTGWAKK
jgi:hypothetical protein